jgi:hypothetical protein
MSKGASKAIVSFYMENLSSEVVRCQRDVLESFAPPGFTIKQILTRHSHAAAIDQFIQSSRYDLIVLLDIDCVPLTASAIPSLADHAGRGALAGCVQRANHITNGGHLYVGPFCMALSRQVWNRLGCPSFEPTGQGDVGEELTFRCEAAGVPVHMLWPSSVEDPVWALTDRERFGPNTEYGGAFLHSFLIREPARQRSFIASCRRLLAAAETDKIFWHRYLDAYEPAFRSLGDVADVLEFGVLDGRSIEWLRRRFPKARIVGVDIAAPNAAWPRGDRIEYVSADQGDRRRIRAMFEELGRRYDVIIDDGSHVPAHQAACLLESFPFVRDGGLYILEDIHTSHPDNPDFKSYSVPGTANCLHVLLAMQHLKDRSEPLTDEIASSLASPEFFTPRDLADLFEATGDLRLYKRTALPLRCYRCGSSAFDYKRWQCRCGVALYGAADSMSFLIRKASSLI